MDGNTLFARQWRVEGVHRQLRDERVPAERDFDSFVVGRTHWEINISSMHSIGSSRDGQLQPM
jgi:hypothetical protein